MRLLARVILLAALAMAAAGAVAASAADPVRLGSDFRLSAPGTFAGGPVVKAAPDGSVAVIWLEDQDGTLDTPGPYRLAVRSRPAASRQWSAVSYLGDPVVDPNNVQLVADSGGNFTAVWTYVEDNAVEATKHVYAATELSGTSVWSESHRFIADGSTAGVHSFSATSTPGGSVAIALSHYDPTDGHEKIAVFRRAAQSGDWTADGELLRPDWVSGLSLAYSGSGHGLLSWRGGDNGQTSVFAALGTLGSGAWSEPQTITSSSDSIGDTRSAIDDGGNAVTSWTRELEGLYWWDSSGKKPGDPGYAPTAPGMLAAGDVRLVASALDGQSGNWGTPVELSPSGVPTVTTDVAPAADGRFIVSYQYWAATPPPVPTAATRIYDPASGLWAVEDKLGDGGAMAGAPLLARRWDQSPAILYITTSDGVKLDLGVRRFGASGWSAQQTVPVALETSRGTPSGAFDGLGDVLVAYPRTDDAGGGVVLAVLDGSPPVLTDLSVPPAAETGVRATMSALATDLWSEDVSVSWDFGDGSAPADGERVRHAYTSPGSYVVTLSAGDGLGHTVTRSATIVVSDPPVDPGPPSPAPVIPPDPPRAPDPVKPQPPAEVVLAGRRLRLNVKLALRPKAACKGTVRASTTIGGAPARVTLRLHLSGADCRATGTLSLRRKPSAKMRLRVTLSGPQVKSRTLPAKR